MIRSMIRTMIRTSTGRRWPRVRPGESLSCPEVGRRLQEYLDGELGDEIEAATLSAHLDECRRCGLEAETYGRIKAALAARCAPVPEESVARLRAFGHRLTAEPGPT